MDQALRHELQRTALRELLDELAAEIGPPDEAMVAETEALLDSFDSLYPAVLRAS